jgi:hypothetical protein
MVRPLIGRAVLTELREYFVREHVLRTIEDAFAAQGILSNPGKALIASGERRKLVEEYYAGLDLTILSDVQKLLRVIEREIARCQPEKDQVTQSPLGSVIIALEQDGYRIDGYRVLSPATTPLAFLQEHLQTIDSQSITNDWERMLSTAETDPEDAITSARALVESTCKSILDELHIPYEDKWDLGRLYKETAKALQLSPGGYKEQYSSRFSVGCSVCLSGWPRYVTRSAMHTARARILSEQLHATRGWPSMLRGR